MAAAAAASPFSLSVLAAMAPSWEALALLSLLLALPDSSSPTADSSGGSGRHGHAAAAGEKKTIHLAGIFPINGIEGWQGGQVRAEIIHARFTHMIVYTASTILESISCLYVEAEYGGREVQNWFCAILREIIARRYAKSAPRWSMKESK